MSVVDFVQSIVGDKKNMRIGEAAAVNSMQYYTSS